MLTKSPAAVQHVYAWFASSPGSKGARLRLFQKTPIYAIHLAPPGIAFSIYPESKMGVAQELGDFLAHVHDTGVKGLDHLRKTKPERILQLGGLPSVGFAAGGAGKMSVASLTGALHLTLRAPPGIDLEDAPVWYHGLFAACAEHGWLIQQEGEHAVALKFGIKAMGFNPGNARDHAPMCTDLLSHIMDSDWSRTDYDACFTGSAPCAKNPCTRGHLPWERDEMAGKALHRLEEVKAFLATLKEAKIEPPQPTNRFSKKSRN
ncbi:hypothetical protein T492DRAFT_1130087 [Pavlovales sp. CCMP2436]|nr:hypothetical protein T492DRAFT_1130087 [Pavlovales sp. CCMP2436]